MDSEIKKSLRLQKEEFSIISDLVREGLAEEYLALYEETCREKVSYWMNGAPSDAGMVNALLHYLYRIVSQNEFNDPSFWTELDEDDYKVFKRTVKNQYMTRFWTDILLLSQRRHLFMYSYMLDDYINKPVKEVW